MIGERGGTSRRTIWDLAIWGAGLVYLALVLVVNLDSPFFGALLIVLAVFQLVGPRRHKSGRRRATIRNDD
jgi:fatty acid desaturase